MKTTHTPGDWYDKPTGSAQHVVASEQTGETIAVVYNDNQANARLIAAAPELLEALRKAAWFIENVTDDDPNKNEMFFECRGLWRNAIDKASDDCSLTPPESYQQSN